MSSTFRIALVFIVAILGAIFIGVGAASDQLQTIVIVLGVSVVGVCLAMGRRVWLLIPFMAYVQLSLRLPGQPSTLEVAQILVTVFGVLLFVTGKIVTKFTITKLEVAIGIFVACVLQVYLRNPVGLSLFGSGSVGGRPYLLFGVGLISALLLSVIRVPYYELKKIFSLSILGGVANIILSFFGYLVPSVGQWIGVGYVQSEYSMQAEGQGGAGRLGFIIRLGPNLALWISSVINPLRAVIKVAWLPLIIIAFMSAGLSGYRNVIAATGLTFVIGIIYRGGLSSLLTSVAVFVLGLMLVSTVNSFNPLPPKLQRSLTFLPGSWEQEYIDEAQESTDWRVEMWKEVLFTEHWIKNKIIGDGLGFTREELEYQEELRYNKGGGSSFGFDSHRATVLVNGDYHSGPVSAVRTVGYLGLFVMLFCMLMIAYRAHRLIIRSKNRKFLPLVLIVCIPLIWAPIFFLFVFGGFSKDAITILMGFGMIRLLENNLPFHLSDDEI